MRDWLCKPLSCGVLLLGGLATPASADAFNVFEARCVDPMFAFAAFSGEGLVPADTDRVGLAVFTAGSEVVGFDTAPSEGRRLCSVETMDAEADVPFAEWVRGMVARGELEPVSDSAWLTTHQVEPRLAVEISSDGGFTTFWLTETHLEAEQEPHVRAWAAPVRGD